MCRHLAYLGPRRTLAELLLDPPYGLYRQSWAPRRQVHGTVNADGFGIGWYADGGGAGDAPETPVRYRRAVPIWADANLPDLARTLRSGAVLAAVRDATPGMSQDESAAAPYRTGRWLFSHNGAVPDWESLPDEPPAGAGLPPAALLGLEARCDSALLWALVHAGLAAGQEPERALADVVTRTAAARPGARLNFLLTDGRTVAATRWGDTLWYRAAHGEVLIASEPCDDTAGADDGGGGGWREVPDRSLLLATPTSVRVSPVERVLTP